MCVQNSCVHEPLPFRCINHPYPSHKWCKPACAAAERTTYHYVVQSSSTRTADVPLASYVATLLASIVHGPIVFFSHLLLWEVGL